MMSLEDMRTLQAGDGLCKLHNSESNEDESGWVGRNVSYTGQSFNIYAFSFVFTSNSIRTSSGVYEDNLTLEGTSTANLGEETLLSQIELFPNSSSGIFNVKAPNLLAVDIDGELLKRVEANNNEAVIKFQG